jgi:hypothetical protein
VTPDTPTCDHCGRPCQASGVHAWRGFERIYIPRSVAELTPEIIDALPQKPASGGRTVVSTSGRYVSYSSVFHLCDDCYSVVSQDENAAAQSSRTTLVVMLAVLVLVSALFLYPGVAAAIWRTLSGQDPSRDFSHRVLAIPLAPYKDPFPTLPNAPAH